MASDKHRAIEEAEYRQAVMAKLDAILEGQKTILAALVADAEGESGADADATAKPRGRKKQDA